MKSSKKPVANEFFEIFKIPLFVFRISGVFPFGFVYQGNRVELQTYSVMTVVAILIYGRLAYHSTRNLMKALYHVIQDPEFALLIAFTDEILMRCFLLTVPLHFWNRGKLLETLFNHWFDYQMNFECCMVTRLYLITSRARKKIRWAVFRVMGMSILISIVVFFLHDLPFEAKFVYVYCILAHSSIAVYWTVSTLYHQACVDIFLETIQVKCKTLNSRQFNKITELWTQFNNLVKEFYDINSALFIYQLKFMIANGVAGLYSCSLLLTGVAFANINDLQKKEILLDLRLALACFTCISVYSERGYQLEKKIKTDMRTELLKMNLTELEPALVNEIWNLLRVGDSNSSGIYFQKYLKINRKFLATILVAVGNFLIIFGQIDYSQSLSNSSLVRARIDTDKLSREW